MSSTLVPASASNSSHPMNNLGVKKHVLDGLQSTPAGISDSGYVHTVGQKIKKKSRAKKLVKSKKSISRKCFCDQIPFFAISKMAKNQFLNWEKV